MHMSLTFLRPISSTVSGVIWPSAVTVVIVRKRRVSHRDMLSINKKFHPSSRDLKELEQTNTMSTRKT